MEFETAADLKKAVEALDGREFKDQRVTCIANVGDPRLLLFPPRLVPLADLKNRPSLTSHHETAAVDPAHQAPAAHTLHGMSSWTAVAHRAVGVRAAITATEALLAATTMTTVRLDTVWMITRRLAVGPWMTTPLPGGVAWMTIHLPVAVLSMTTLLPRGTSPLARPGTPGKADTTLRAITTAVTGN